jgi:hypothetical protein
MKNFIYTSVVIFGAFLFLSGCYTVLDLPERDYTETYEPVIIIIDFPPDPGPPPPPRPDPPRPNPDPLEPIIAPYNPPSPPYQRPKEISDPRNGGEGRNSDTDRSRR